MAYELELADDITLSELDELCKENKHLIKGVNLSAR